jgi:hypothetical protein
VLALPPEPQNAVAAAGLRHIAMPTADTADSRP